MKQLLLFLGIILFLSFNNKLSAQCIPDSIMDAYANDQSGLYIYWNGNYLGDTSQIVVVEAGYSPDSSSNCIINDTVISISVASLNRPNLSPLVPNTKYTAYVRTLCINETSQSEWSRGYSFIAKSIPPISSAIASLYTYNMLIPIYLSWNQANYNDTVNVYRFGDQWPGGILVAPFLSGSSNIYDTIANFSYGEYWYIVKLIKNGKETFSTQSNTFTYSKCSGFTVAFDNYAPYKSTSVTFNNNSSSNFNHFYWDFGDNSTLDTSYSSYVNHIYAVDGYYNICLSASNKDSGCQAQVCKYLPTRMNLPNIKPSFTYSDSSLKVSFYNNTTDTLQFYWTFGDGDSSTQYSPTHPYQTEGYYKVCLTATDVTSGMASTTCEDVLVGNPTCKVRAGFNYMIMDTSNVSFSSTSTGDISHFYWYFDDGTVASTDTVTHPFKTNGNHYVSLTVYDSIWNCSDFTEKYIQLGNIKCKADFYFSVNANTVSYSNKSRGDINSYYWDFGDGGYAVDSAPSPHIYNKQGLYNVWLSVANKDYSCVDYSWAELQVGSFNCKASFDYAALPASTTCQFTNQSIGTSTSVYWDFGDGYTSTEANPNHDYKFNGYFYATLSIFNKDNKCFDNTSNFIVVGDPGIDCEAAFKYHVDPAAKTVNFTDYSTGGVNKWFWDFGDGQSSTEQNAVNTFATTGYYNVCLYVSNTSGIANLTCKEIAVATNPDKDCKADFSFSIDGTSRDAKFSDESYGNITNWAWDLGDGTYSTNQYPTYSYPNPGFYMVSLKVSNTKGCDNKTYKLVNAGMTEDGLKAGFGADARPPDKKAGGYPVDFVGAGMGDNAQLRWDFGDGESDTTSTTPTHYYTSKGKYYACYTIYDPVTEDTAEYCDTVATMSRPVIIVNPSINEEFTVFPNPTKGLFTLKFNLANDNKLKIELIDITGKSIAGLHEANLSSGDYQLSFDVSSFQKGMYFIKFTAPGLNKIAKLVLK